MHPWTSAHVKPCIISKHLGHLAVHISHADVLTRSCTWLLFLRSRHSSHILVCGSAGTGGAQLPFGSGAVWLQTAAFGCGAVDSWPAISGRPEHNYAGNTWSYGVEVLCGFTDGEHEFRKPKHMWTDDDLEPVQMMDTETRKVIAMMLVILQQMSRMFVYSRRIKDLRELEAQHRSNCFGKCSR